MFKFPLHIVYMQEKAVHCMPAVAMAIEQFCWEVIVSLAQAVGSDW